VVQILMFFMARDLISVSILYAIFAAINTVLTAALIPVMYCFMPQEKFGQLNGSNQIVGRILQIVGANACSFIIVLAQGDYRYAFIFGGVAYMLTPVFLWLMLRQPWPYGNLTTSMNPNGSAALNPDLPKQPAPQPAE
jgi:hypothetical protein